MGWHGASLIGKTWCTTRNPKELIMQTLFVYYKLPVSEHQTWRPRVEAFQNELKQKWSGLSTELMQRPEATLEGIETWMEIYRHTEGVTQDMMDSIAASAIAHQLPPKRMSEFFIPLR
jgi:hypothetical protein